MENRKSRKSTFLYVILLTLCVPLAYVYLILVTGLLDKIQEGHIGLTLMIVFLPLFFYWGLVAVVGIINIGQSFKIYKTGNPIECVNRMLIHKYGLVVFFCVNFLVLFIYYFFISIYIREDYLIKTVLDQITFLQEKFSEGKIEFRRFIYSAINHRTSEHIRQVNSRIKAIQERLNQIRTTETKMYEDKLMGKVDEETFHNITHVLNNEARNLTDENSQLLVILDKVEDLKMGIDNFVQKIERFANCTVTENDRVIMEQLIDHIEVYENDSNEISVRIFFADIGVIE